MVDQYLQSRVVTKIYLWYNAGGGGGAEEVNNNPEIIPMHKQTLGRITQSDTSENLGRNKLEP